MSGNFSVSDDDEEDEGRGVGNRRLPSPNRSGIRINSLPRIFMRFRGNFSNGTMRRENDH